MKKITQRSQNPFEYTDSNKRYHTYDYYLRKKFGQKCAKIPLDAGFTCPNIDGKCAYGGCIYCSGRGSGDFAESPELSISEQYFLTREKLSSKWSTEHCIAYFQAHTNTYAPLDVIKAKFEEAVSLGGVAALNIATRADCLDGGVAEYIAALAERLPVTVELGLQSVYDKTAELINRGHTYAQFVSGYECLRALSDKLEICVHIIFGLPGEDREMMLGTVREVAKLHPEHVKIHLLHVLEGTKMAGLYKSGQYTPMQKDEYVSTVADAIELLPADIVIDRLTGDGTPDALIAPEWSRKKVSVINDIDKLLYQRGTYQGINS